MTDEALIKIFTLTTISFLCGLTSTPLLTHLLYKYKLGKQIRSDGTTPIFTELHKSKDGTPTMGGMLIWGITAGLAIIFWLFDRVLNLPSYHHFNFLTRRETLLPLGAFVGSALVGLTDDYLDVRRKGHKGRGMRFRFKVLLYALVASIGAWWFYFKLGFTTVFIPFYGPLDLGLLFIPFFLLVVIGTSFAVNQTDGLDGLAGGSLLIAFFSFALIAYSEGRINLASMLACVCGSLLSFLWFNVPPARFYMGDTGSMGMGVLLAIVAFLTNSVMLLPIIGLVFLVEAVSTILQLSSKAFFKKKIFLSAPLHHHFEAIGWPESKIVMRSWIVSAIAGIVGTIIFFLSK